jgi:hydrogenase nickel incorporation protein HypA/HybF
MSIVEALIEQVQREIERSGQVGRVTRLDLVIGRLSGVNPDSIRFAFELLSPGTPLDSADLTITEPKAVCHCHACGSRKEIDEFVVQCPVCQDSDILIEGGQELLLQSIEVEEAAGG